MPIDSTEKTSRKPLYHFFVRFYFVSVLSLWTMTSRGEMLYPVLPQAESTLDSTKLTIVSLSKRKKNLPVTFLFAILIVYAKLFK